jgi:hypothetical protein
LNGLKVERIKKISTPLWIACSIWVIGEWTFFDQLDENLHFGITLIGIGIFIGVGITELYIYLSKKKKISA